MEIRFDRGPLKRPERKGRSFVVEGYAARVHAPGDPLRYDHGDEYRDAIELGKLVEQLAGLSVTLPHPPGLLRNGAKACVVGRVDAAWLDADRAGVRMTITDEVAARAIESGIKELSLGYETSVDDAGYQHNSRADHLAIVSTARCGAACSLRTDDKSTCSCGCGTQFDRENTTTEGSDMAKDTPSQERVDELVGENKTLTARIAQLEADLVAGAQAAESEKIAAEKTRADAAEAKVARFDETFQAAVRARTKLEREAGKVMGPEFRMDDMTERQIHEVVVKRLDANADVKSVSDAELRGQYQVLASLSAKNVESQKRVAEILGRADESDRKDEAPSHETIENNRWKKTLSKGRDTAAEGR